MMKFAEENVVLLVDNTPLFNIMNHYDMSAFQQCPTANHVLEIVEQPTEMFRYRYQTEKGAHGSLMGRNNNRNREKSYPKIKIKNYRGSLKLIVRLYAKRENRTYIPHVHTLAGQSVTEGSYEKTFEVEKDMIIDLSNIYISQTAKKDVKAILTERYRNDKLQDKMLIGVPGTLTPEEEREIKEQVDKDRPEMNSMLDSVYLGIEAYGENRFLDSVYSDAIKNERSAKNGVLKICKLSRAAGSARGGDEMIILCEKVDKKNIEVWFFQEQDDDLWEAKGEFGEMDVHHQVAITLKIPPYRNTEIESSVDVEIQLRRPNKPGDVSDSKLFTYYPDDYNLGRKRKKEMNPNTIPEEKPQRKHTDKECRKMTSAKRSNALKVEITPSNQYQQPEQGAVPQTAEIIEDLDELTSIGEPVSSGHGSVDNPMLNQTTNFNQPIYTTEDLAALANYNPESFDSSPLISGNDPMLGQDINMQHRPTDMDTSTSFPSFSFEDVVSDGVPERRTSRLISRGSDKENSSEEKVITTRSTKTDDFLKAREKIINKVLCDKNASGYQVVYNLAVKSAEALQNYAKTSDIKIILNTMSHLVSIQDENGDNCIHNAVIHAKEDSNAIFNLIEVIADYNSEFDPLNMFNYLIQTPLHIAVHINYPKIVESLVRHGADPNNLDRHGNSALHLASHHGKDEVVEILLNFDNYKCESNKPVLDQINYDGLTSLHLAVLSGSVTCVKKLCEAGADVNFEDGTSGKSAIHLAVELKNLAILKELLRQQMADVNRQTFSGYTALHIACMSGSLDIIRQLMAAKADPNIETFDIEESSDDENLEKSSASKNDDIHGYTSFDLAENNSEIQLLLIGQESGPSASLSEIEPVKSIVPVASYSIQDNIKENENKQFRSERRSVDLDDSGFISKSEDYLQKSYGQVSDVAPEDSGLGLMNETERMDEKTKRKLASVLDPEGEKDWKHLASILDLDDLCSMIGPDVGSSPTIMLLSNIESLAELQHGLEALGNDKAVQIVEAYRAGLADQQEMTKIEGDLTSKLQNIRLHP